MSSFTTDTVLSLYQSERLLPYSDRVLYGFTGKPNSLGGPDTPDNPLVEVRQNRQALLANLPFILNDASPRPEHWLTLEQVHGHRIGRTRDTQFCKTDGIILTMPHQPVMLMFADCVPVMLYDPAHHIGAVLHAGWRGTAQTIAAEGVITMGNIAGSRPEDLIAVIGPAIGGCCFQVSEAVAQAVGESVSSSQTDLCQQGLRFDDPAYPENPRIDLKGINRLQLTQAGVQHIETLPACTYCETESLFSYRRGDHGRNSAWMMLLPSR